MPASDSPVAIDTILNVDELPPPEARGQTTLYIPKKEGVDRRDRFLGAFLGNWSALENALLVLLWKLLRSDYASAEVIFHSAISIRTPVDMITGLMMLKRPADVDGWKPISSDILTLSNNRNHLVHGKWISEATVGADDIGRPVLTALDWIRVYMTGDPAVNVKTRAAPAPTEKPSPNRYDLERIKKKIAQTTELHGRLSTFMSKIPEPPPSTGS